MFLRSETELKEIAGTSPLTRTSWSLEGQAAGCLSEKRPSKSATEAVTALASDDDRLASARASCSGSKGGLMESSSIRRASTSCSACHGQDDGNGPAARSKVLGPPASESSPSTARSRPLLSPRLFEHAEQVSHAAHGRRSSSTSIHTPADAGKTTWSPGWTGICTPTWGHQSRPGPTASTMPCWGGDSCSPGGSTRPERRTRSGSSSLITIWSNRGRSCCLTPSRVLRRFRNPYVRALKLARQCPTSARLSHHAIPSVETFGSRALRRSRRCCRGAVAASWPLPRAVLSQLADRCRSLRRLKSAYRCPITRISSPRCATAT